MWGVVTYMDVFGIPRTSKFCQSILWLKNGTTMGVNTLRHNEAT